MIKWQQVSILWHYFSHIYWTYMTWHCYIVIAWHSVVGRRAFVHQSVGYNLIVEHSPILIDIDKPVPLKVIDQMFLDAHMHLWVYILVVFQNVFSLFNCASIFVHEIVLAWGRRLGLNGKVHFCFLGIEIEVESRASEQSGLLILNKSFY